jgi:hypothetical protein
LPEARTELNAEKLPVMEEEGGELDGEGRQHRGGIGSSDSGLVLCPVLLSVPPVILSDHPVDQSFIVTGASGHGDFRKSLS